jgi:hypothetical protein
VDLTVNTGQEQVTVAHRRVAALGGNTKCSVLSGTFGTSFSVKATFQTGDGDIAIAAKLVVITGVAFAGAMSPAVSHDATAWAAIVVDHDCVETIEGTVAFTTVLTTAPGLPTIEVPDPVLHTRHP